MARSHSFWRLAGAAAFCALAATPALAGQTVPAPLIGAGLPALALFGAGYWVLRKRRGG